VTGQLSRSTDDIESVATLEPLVNPGAAAIMDNEWHVIYSLAAIFREADFRTTAELLRSSPTGFEYEATTTSLQRE
jgi:hypothetical protein